jgi:hypothetical protein
MQRHHVVAAQVIFSVLPGRFYCVLVVVAVYLAAQVLQLILVTAVVMVERQHMAVVAAPVVTLVMAVRPAILLLALVLGVLVLVEDT